MTGDLDSRPPRPFLPPLLVAGLVLWAATALIWPTLRLAPTAAFPVLGMLALGAAVWLASHALRAARGGGFSLGALAALSLAAAVALCSFWAGALRGSMAYAEAQGGDSAPATWHAELTEDARRGDFGWHAEARLRGADGRVLRVRLNLPEDAALLQGQSMTASGTLKPPAEAAAAYYWDTGLAGSLTASESAFVSEEAALDSGPFRPSAAMRPGSHRRVRGRQCATSTGSCVRLEAGHRGIGALRLLQGRGAGPSRGGIGGAPLHCGSVRCGRIEAAAARPQSDDGGQRPVPCRLRRVHRDAGHRRCERRSWPRRGCSRSGPTAVIRRSAHWGCAFCFSSGSDPACRPFGLLRLVGGIHPGDRSIRTAAVLGLRGASRD